MSASEFQAWKAFYAMYPFDDLHRYHRPAAMVAAAWGGKYKQLIDFLAPEPEIDMPSSENSKFSKADIATMNAMMQMAGKK